MRELFQGIGAAYRLVWLAVSMMARSSVAIAGVVVLAMLTVIAGKPATDAIPYAVLWLLVGGTCRMVIRVLPAPDGAGDRIPTEKPLPPAMLAVNITPLANPMGCPGLDNMTVSLNLELKPLLQNSNPNSF